MNNTNFDVYARAEPGDLIQMRKTGKVYRKVKTPFPGQRLLDEKTWETVSIAELFRFQAFADDPEEGIRIL